MAGRGHRAQAVDGAGISAALAISWKEVVPTLAQVGASINLKLERLHASGRATRPRALAIVGDALRPFLGNRYAAIDLNPEADGRSDALELAFMDHAEGRLITGDELFRRLRSKEIG